MCYTPLTLKHPHNGDDMQVPCGKCPKCLARRVSGWSFRLQKHDKHNECSHFLTLTYNTDNVPISKRGFMTLKKEDIQLFMKRLRKMHPKNHPKISYYVCGEYGSKSFRPHYHYIIYNCDINLIEKAWINPKTKQPIGDIFIGHTSGASVGYVLKYMCKDKRIPLHKNDDRLPEFSNMSKGLGSSYIDINKQWHLNDLENRFYVPIEGGKKIAMPRYYKQKIYSEEQLLQLNEVNRIRHNEKLAELEQKLAAAEIDIQTYTRNLYVAHQNKQNKKNEKI